MDLVRDCLDKQLVDRHGHKMGRVDSIILEVGAGRRPTVSAIEIGSVCLAARLHPRLARVVRSISKRLSVVNHDPFRLPWSKVAGSSGIEVIAAVEAEKTPALAWELWLRKKIIARIPGA
jgi:hypothetical protein